MKLIIKNDNRDIVKNPNVKIVETTELTFTNQTVFIEENDVPIIKYTDTESMYFVKDLDNLYDRKSKSEVLLDITIDNLELIGSGSSRPYKVYTALLTQSGTDAPVATVLENTLGEITYSIEDLENSYYTINSDNLFVQNKTAFTIAPTISSSITIAYDNSSKIYIYASSSDNLSNTFIEIRVYN